MNTAILLSGGVGTRLGGDIPKQYMNVGGKMIISFALEALMRSEYIDCICIVADKKWQGVIRGDLHKDSLRCESVEKVLVVVPKEKTASGRVCQKKIYFAAPGRNRQESILNGMNAIRDEMVGVDTVFVHDAARPILSHKMIATCYKALPGHDGVMPALPMSDTVYLSEDGSSITGLLDRSKIFAGQAPELFLFDKYYEANVRLSEDELLQIKGSTQPAIMAGMDIAIIPGDPANYKITTIEDFQRFEREIMISDAEKGKNL